MEVREQNIFFATLCLHLTKTGAREFLMIMGKFYVLLATPGHFTLLYIVFMIIHYIPYISVPGMDDREWTCAVSLELLHAMFIL